METIKITNLVAPKKFMEKNKTLTIVTPSLNQGQYIEQTIKSVLDQAGDFSVDYIIADGDSNDQTIEIIKKYDKLLKKGLYPIKCNGVEFRWWSKKDKGQSNAINQGLKIAKGEILAWINSDDFYEPQAFKFIMNKFKENPDVDLIYGDGYIINEKTKIIKTYPKIQGNLNMLLKGDCFIFQPSTFFTKSIINKVNLLDESLHYAMDYDLWIKIFKNSKTLYLNKILANFRIWENSKSGSQQKNFLIERKIIFKRYGCNIIRRKTIYKIRNKIPGANFFKKKFPIFYKQLKCLFYFFINKFQYKSKNRIL